MRNTWTQQGDSMYELTGIPTAQTLCKPTLDGIPQQRGAWDMQSYA